MTCIVISGDHPTDDPRLIVPYGRPRTDTQCGLVFDECAERCGSVRDHDDVTPEEIERLTDSIRRWLDSIRSGDIAASSVT